MMDLTDEDKALIDEFQKRREAFWEVCRKIWNEYGEPYETWNRYPCPACGYPTLGELGNYDMCILCDWEDDGIDDNNIDEMSGPNSGYSLTEARLNFARYGTMYPPGDEEMSQRFRDNHFWKTEMRRLFESLVGVNDKKEIRARVLEIIKFSGGATTLEEFLAAAFLTAGFDVT